MSAQQATIVDFQAYRRARAARTANPATNVTMPAVATLGAMTWVPVWFMPVYWVGTPVAAD